MTEQIHYKITPADPHAHLFRVVLTIQKPDTQGQRLQMPAWIPGSYMIRDFAKNLVSLKANSQGRALRSHRVDKSTWRIEPCNGVLIVEYDVYAWDVSVRTAHLDQTHAYFNGTSVFLAVVGQEHLPCVVDIQNAPIEEARHWRVATTLKEKTAERYGFGLYQAENYDDLIDHPVEIAEFTLGQFEACGIPHEIVLSGKHYADVDRICDDLKKICEYQINLFGQPAPMARYLFLTWVVGNGYGGLEHRDSTSLICNRSDLPGKGQTGYSEEYQTFLGLCSHEYFHTWNVKRIKPAAFLPYKLDKETHTELLWAFEGITSYYDDLVLHKAGLITENDYLKLIGKTFTRLQRNLGRKKQTVTDSSFDAWTKFYKQDENAINAIVSYYAKGSQIALGLDLLLRKCSQGKVSLDHLMRYLWENFGKVAKGVENQDIQSAAKSLCPEGAEELENYFATVLYSVEDYDYQSLFAEFGIELKVRARQNLNDAGGNPIDKPKPVHNVGVTIADDARGAKVTSVINQSCACEAGLSAGDVIIAIDSIQVNKSNFEQVLGYHAVGEEVTVHAFRDDLLMTFKLKLEESPADTVYFTVKDEERLKQWLSC